MTFDNAWIDTYTNAFPLLKHYNFPAAVFPATSYVGTIKPYWQDGLAMALLTLKEAEFPLEELKLLSSALNDTNASSIKLIETLVPILNNSSKEKRNEVMLELAQAVDSIGGFPIEQSFMNWEQIKEMSQQGISFGSQGHTRDNFETLSEKEIDDEIINSIQFFRQQQIPILKTFCFPEDKINSKSREMLAGHGFQYALSLGKHPLPKSKPKGVTILGRVPIYQAVSSNKEFLVSEIFND